MREFLRCYRRNEK